MNIGDALSALAASLQSHLGVPFVIGRPSPSLEGVVVWPWRIDPAAHAFPPTRGGEAVIRPPLLVEVSVLVVAGAGCGADDADRIGAVLRVLHDEPVIDHAGAQFQVLPHPLPAELLTSIFSAAGLPLALCSSHVLRIVL